MRILNKKRLKNPIKKSHLIILFSILTLTACNYYYHLARGQLDLLSKRQPIQQVLDDPKTDSELKHKLTLSLEAREFAQQSLLLPVGDNYLHYVDVGRPYVVWNIYAAPELSLEPVTWCFPIIGCVSYRGYFDRDSAINYAKSYQDRGFDVSVGGIRAYSTLGLIPDPLLSTFMSGSDTDIISLIFHETAHKILFSPGDVTFNESFATSVELEGLERWIAANGFPDEYDLYLLNREYRAGLIQMILDYGEKLSTIYESSITSNEKRQQKSDTINEFELEFAAYADLWASKGANVNRNLVINNALFGRVQSYNGLVPKFQELLNYLDGELYDFYEVCKRLADMDQEDRQRLMAGDVESIVQATGYAPKANTAKSAMPAMLEQLNEPADNRTIHVRPTLQ